VFCTTAVPETWSPTGSTRRVSHEIGCLARDTEVPALAMLAADAGGEARLPRSMVDSSQSARTIAQLVCLERRTATFEFLRPLLESRDLAAGEPRSEAQTFSQWEGNASEILARIEESWPAGAPDPDIGGDIWFTSPS
jgi:hypothetical protein